MVYGCMLLLLLFVDVFMTVHYAATLREVGLLLGLFWQSFGRESLLPRGNPVLRRAEYVYTYSVFQVAQLNHKLLVRSAKAKISQISTPHTGCLQLWKTWKYQGIC